MGCERTLKACSNVAAPLNPNHPAASWGKPRSELMEAVA